MPDAAEHQHSHDHPHHHADDHSEAHDVAQMGVEAYGVGMVISAPAQVLPRVQTVLPPGWREKKPAAGDEHFALRPHENRVYSVVQGTGRELDSVSGSSDLLIALEVLDTRIRAHIALHAPDHIFVHAGVVGHRGRAIVIPGRSFSGKTTLVAELVRAGATYYSDEFAVLDDAGRVHPYPKPLSIRSEKFQQVDHAVETLGGTAGAEPLPIGLVAVAQYSPDAQWDPTRLSSGEAVLAMLDNTIPAQERPEQVMTTLRKAVDGAVVLQGQRGEAAATARDLLASLRD